MACPRELQSSCDRRIYSQESVERGVTAERRDMSGASVPYQLFFDVQKQAVDQIREDDAQYYDRLEKSG